MSNPRRLARRARMLRWLLNLYPPYLGAGIRVQHISPDMRSVKVCMKLTRWNRNYVGTQFGGSLYSMVDPFFMLLLLHHLGSKYIVWDKAAEINFLSPGRSTVHADIRVDLAEIEQIRELADNFEPVLRTYHLNIFDETGVRIAEVQKTLYIRRKKAKPFQQ